MCLNIWIKEETTRQIRSYFDMNKNKNTTKQNIWDAYKTVLRRKFIAINIHIIKEERSQVNNLTSHLKKLKKEQTKLKSSTRKY